MATMSEVAALIAARLDLDIVPYVEALIEAGALPDLDEPAIPDEAALLLLAVLATDNPGEAAAAAEPTIH